MVVAHTADGLLIGFVNVPRDGGSMRFLIDTTTRDCRQRHGTGTELVRRAAAHRAGSECD